MKGSQTIITAPDGKWRYEGGGVGLGTCGSGDVLAGIIAELVARGTKPAVAANGAFSSTVKQARSSQRKLAASGSWLVKFPT
jgi:NAD(P)H-hydrate repair Nnr-like enzyme with NAD(P)H-hydrate dehydratase domain